MRIAVLGASGYTGGELVRLLAGHRRAEVTFLGANGSADKTLVEVHPHLAPVPIAREPLQPIEWTDADEHAAEPPVPPIPPETGTAVRH